MDSYPDEFIFVMCFMFILETVAGAVFNIYVIYKRITSKPNRCNTDGRNFITTLKSMDLIISVTAIPMTFVMLVLNRNTNRTACLFKESLVMFASSGSSLCVLLISIDRYCAIVLPTRRVFTKHRIIKCKVTVFIVASIGFILPSFSLTTEKISNETTSETSMSCRYMLWSYLPYYMYELYCVVAFVTTMIFVFLTYNSVLKVVRRRTEIRLNAASTSSDASNARLRQQEMKATRVTYSVVITFLICWGPHVVGTVVRFFKPNDLSIDILQVVCLFVAFLTTVIHPLIYTQTDSSPGTVEQVEFILNRMTSRNKIVPDQAMGQMIEDRGQPSTSVSYMGSSTAAQHTSSSTKSSASNGNNA